MFFKPLSQPEILAKKTSLAVGKAKQIRGFSYLCAPFLCLIETAGKDTLIQKALPAVSFPYLSQVAAVFVLPKKLNVPMKLMLSTLIKTTGFSILLAFGLLSCNDDVTQVGLDLQDEGRLINTIFTDTVTISTSLMMIDSLNTTNQARLLVGENTDPVFGTTRATAFAQLAIGLRENVSFPANSIYDSVVFRIGYQYEYGDTNTVLNIQVHELAEKIDTITYFNTSSLAVLPTPIGSATLRPAGNARNVFSFPLDPLFGRKIFGRGGQPELANQANFENFIRGLRISATPQQGNYMFGINVASLDTEVRLYYREPSADTMRVQFVAFFLGRRFNKFEADLSGTPLQRLRPGVLLPTSEAGNIGAIQAGAGIATVIRFPHLGKIAPEGRRMLINRADLLLPTRPQSITGTTPPPDNIFFAVLGPNDKFERDPTGPVRFLAQELTPDRLNAFTYNPSGRSFGIAPLTLYLQGVVNGTETENGLVLYPGNINNSVNRFIFDVPGGNASTQLRLRLYYTLF